MTGRQLERFLYQAARQAGDVNAASRSPQTLTRRLARRQFTRRITGPATTALFRSLFR